MQLKWESTELQRCSPENLSLLGFEEPEAQNRKRLRAVYSSVEGEFNTYLNSECNCCNVALWMERVGEAEHTAEASVDWETMGCCNVAPPSGGSWQFNKHCLTRWPPNLIMRQNWCKIGALLVCTYICQSWKWCKDIYPQIWVESDPFFMV